jgi:hypothetical protein
MTFEGEGATRSDLEFGRGTNAKLGEGPYRFNRGYALWETVDTESGSISQCTRHTIWS